MQKSVFVIKDIMKQTNKTVNVIFLSILLECHLSCETCENTNNHCLSCLDIYNRILTNN